MNKTNSKATKEAVRAYLLNVISDEEVNTLSELRERFIKEYGYMISRTGEINACIEWLRGLAIGCAFYYWDIARLMARFLDDTVENQEEWINKKGDGLYWLLLAREIVNAK